MRHFLTLVVYVLSFSTACGQELKLYNSIQNEAFYSIERFTNEYFDVSLNFPSQACTNVEIKITLPVGIVYTRLNTPGYSETQANNVIIFKNDASNSINNGAFSINFTAQVKGDGTVCENTPLNVTGAIDYKDAETQNICQSYVCEPLKVIPKYDTDKPKITFYDQSNTQCKGGAILYTIGLGMPDKRGGYNLTIVKLRLKIKGKLLNVQNYNGSIPWTYINSNNCESNVEFNLGTLKVDEGRDFYLTVETNCDCDNIASGEFDLGVEVSGEGKNPCNSVVSFSNQLIKTTPKICCDEGQYTPIFTTYMNNGLMCYADCAKNIFGLQYNPMSLPVTTEDLTIHHIFPDDIFIESIFLDNKRNTLTSYPIELEYKTNLNNWRQHTINEPISSNNRVIEVKFLNEPADPSYYSYIDIQIGERIIEVRYKLLYDIAPFSLSDYLQTYFRFRVINNVINLNPINTNVTFGYTQSNEYVEYSFETEMDPDRYNCRTVYDYKPFIHHQNNEFREELRPNSMPNETLKFRYVFSNSLIGNEIRPIQIKLPPEVIFVGNYSHYIGNVNPEANPNVVFPNGMPANAQIQYDPVTHTVTWSNFYIDGSCDGSLLFKAFEFEVKIKPYTLAGIYLPQVTFQDQTRSVQSFQVPNMLLVKGIIKRNCGEVLANNDVVKVKVGEEVNLIYSIQNEGNVPVRDFIISNLLPKVNDYTLNPNNATTLDRNSTFYMEASSGQSALPNGSYGYHDQIADLSIFQTPNNNYTKDFVQIKMNGLIPPGQSRDAELKVRIQDGVATGQIANNDFYFYGYDANITNLNVAVQGNSEAKSFIISLENDCPKQEVCDPDYNLSQIVENAFDVNIVQNRVSVSAQGLSPNDRWYPIWEPMINGGSGYHWGNGTYQTSHNFQVGRHKVCMKVENMTAQTNSQENICNCTMICKEINIY